MNKMLCFNVPLLNSLSAKREKKEKKEKKVWFKSGSVKVKAPVTPGLPDPSLCSTQRDTLITETANDSVDTMTAATTPTRKRKRGDYNFYDDETRAKIAKYSVENGVARAARKFSSDLGKKLSETSVRSMRDTYLNLKKQGIYRITLHYLYELNLVSQQNAT